MPRRPYIGITGFMDPAQVVACLDRFPRHSSHAMMAGVLVSDKTMSDKGNRWIGQYPQDVTTIAGIFVSHPNVFNVLHYSKDEADPELRWNDLNQVVGIGGPNLNGIQINMPWPSVWALKHLRDFRPEIEVILQISAASLAAVDHNPDKFLAKIKDYLGIADYLLFDMSGGFGKSFDITEAQTWLRHLAQTHFGIVVGGGLEAATVREKISPLLETVPGLSIDAQGRLRTAPPGRPDHEGALDLTKALPYLFQAFDVFHISY